MLKAIGFLTSLCILSFIGSLWMEQVKTTSLTEVQEMSNTEKTLSEGVEGTVKAVAQLAKESIPQVKELVNDSVVKAKSILRTLEADETERDDFSADLTESETAAEDDYFEGDAATGSQSVALPSGPDKWDTIKETEGKLIAVSNMLNKN